MGIVYTPPIQIAEEDYIQYMVFLAGSIEMDTAENWQKVLAEELVKIDKLTILNPRRTQWDSSWEQKIENPNFREQVDWELNGIENSDMVIFYFDPNTKSPITLAELGMVSQMVRLEKRVIICCPDGFYRKGNVDIIVDRMKNLLKENPFYQAGTMDDHILQVNNLSELKEKSVNLLRKLLN